MTRDEAWFVSDVHLKDGHHDYLEQFLEFLDLAAHRTRSLYFVGDIFEFWIGDRQARTSFYSPVFDRIRAMTTAGVAIRVIHGNRDFLLGESMCEAGAEMLPESTVLDLAGARVHVSHGDRFCEAEGRGGIMRSLTRSRIARWTSRHLPAVLGRVMALGYRGLGERKQSKEKRETGNRFHTIEEGVRTELERGDHDVLLCGHIHWLNDGSLVVGDRPRRVITTGAWEEGPNYVAFDGEDLAIRRFERTSSTA